MKELKKNEIGSINGGVAVGTAIAIGIAAAAAYDVVKHFALGLFSPFTSNED